MALQTPIEIPAAAITANGYRIDSQNPVTAPPISQIMTYPFWPNHPDVADGLLINFPNVTLSTQSGTPLWTGYLTLGAAVAGINPATLALLQRLMQPPLPAVFAVVVEGSHTLYAPHSAEVVADRITWLNLQF